MRTTARFPGFETPEAERWRVLPRAVPWESNLPWAAVIISQMAAAVGDDRGRGSACAKAVGARTRRSAGTSVTAKTPSACAWSGAGRRPNVRPNGARMMRSKPSTPRRNGRAVSVPSLRHNRRRSLTLRRPVVTQQKLFFRLLCATGRGAMNRPPRRTATRRATAVRPAARPFAGCSIVSASGGSAALFRAAALACASIRLPAPGAAANHAILPARRRPGRRQRNQVHPPRRSAVDGLAPPSPYLRQHVRV